MLEILVVILIVTKITFGILELKEEKKPQIVIIRPYSDFFEDDLDLYVITDDETEEE